MDKLLVDTNAFEKIGFNFDKKNAIISQLIKNVKEKEYEYYSVSVIDNEIISHINNRCLKQYNEIKKTKWIMNYITEEEIKKNCYKDLKDYEDFKNCVSAISCNISNIDPEQIFDKYFKTEYPFEKGENKKYEFPDAFISSFINNIKICNNEKIYFITNDKGLKKSLNSNVIVYKDLEAFLSDINNINPKKYKVIKEYIENNIEVIQSQILKNLNLEYFDLEDEIIDVENLIITKIKDLKVIGNDNNKYSISCTCNLTLNGSFSCLDYNNSYMPNDCDFYVVQEYLKLESIFLDDYDFILEVSDTDGNFSFHFLDCYNLKLDYELLEESYYEQYTSYDGETSFSQDGGNR